MNGLPYYKRYPRDFIEGTVGLPFEVKGAYAIVLDLIYLQGGNLPDDPRYISGLLGVSVRKWKSLRAQLIEADKLQVSGEFLSAKIADLWARKLLADQRRPWVPVAVQHEVWDRDGQVCAYCGNEDGPFHLDHIFPWSRGGRHSSDNLTVACAACNWSKGDKTLDEWRVMQ